MPAIQIYIPHRAPAMVLEIESADDLLTPEEREDKHAVYDFDSVDEAVAWAKQYTGHQSLRVRALLEELDA